MPFISGMFQSDSTRSGACSATTSSALGAVHRPRRSSWSPYPAWRSVRMTIMRMALLSSTIRIFMGPHGTFQMR